MIKFSSGWRSQSLFLTLPEQDSASLVDCSREYSKIPPHPEGWQSG